MRINDTDLYVRTEGAGPPLLVMHGGLGVDHTCLQPFLSPLKAQVELVFYDHRGNGRSPADLTGVTFDTWVDDAEALRAALGHDRIVVFGHSAGGFFALRYALRYPERVAGLILCGTAAVLNHWDLVHQELDRRDATTFQRRGFSDLPFADDNDLATWLAAALPLYFHHPDPSVISRMAASTIVSSAASRRFGECLGDYGVADCLGEITAPALILAGRHDFIMPPRPTAEVLAAGLPQASLIVFEDSGHFPFIEEPERFLATVGDWLAGLAMPDASWRLSAVATPTPTAVS